MTRSISLNIPLSLLLLLFALPGCRKVDVNTLGEVETPLNNPGIGLHTFHRFDGDLSQEDYPTSSVAYFRFYWNQIEPNRGDIQFAALEEALATADARGQTLGLRIMLNGAGAVRVPQWALDLGVTGVSYQRDGQESFMPHFENPVLLAEMERLLNELGQAFDGDPRLEFMDIGVLGMTGEWHMGESGLPLPADSVWKRIIDMHFDAFPNTQLIMLVGDTEDEGAPLAYALAKGAGWRADCLGDLLWRRNRWNHMESFYPDRILNEAAAGDAWKTAPVIFETCGDPSDWVRLGLRPEEIYTAFEYALDYHVSLVNFRNRPLPSGLRPYVDQFLNRMGYQFRLNSVTMPEAVTRGEVLNVQTTWSNEGVAPTYKPFKLVLRLRNGQDVYGDVEQPQDLRQWMPGTHVVDCSIPVAMQIPPRTYQVDMGIRWRRGVSDRMVAFRGDGAMADGWMQVGEVEVVW